MAKKTPKEPKIDRKLARKVLEVVDAGLSHGVGKPKPGEMCVEAAVCYAMGLPHGDNPSCVAPVLRDLKIRLNDRPWSSPMARAKGLRRLAIAQLGSAGHLDEKKFLRRIAVVATKVSVANALRHAAGMRGNAKHKDALLAAAERCAAEGTRESAKHANEVACEARRDAYAAAAAYAYAAADAAETAAAYAAADADAYAAAYAYAAAAAYAARDKELSAFAEGVVQVLIEMKAPGAEFLDLAPLEVAA